MSMRRRGHDDRNDTEDGDVQESLLPPNGTSVANELLCANTSIASIVAAVWQGWHFCIQMLAHYFEWVFGLGYLSSQEQLAKIRALRRSVATKFNENDPEHQVEIAGLWKLCFPKEPWFCGPSDRWKDAGFQSSNPATDFRGGGLFSLRNLIYMGENHSEVFHRLLWKKDGSREEFEYPFCAAGINLTFNLELILELRGRSAQALPENQLPTSRVGVLFAKMLMENDHAFEEIYVATFQLLDRIWLARMATYMEFPSVLEETMLMVKRTMLKGPRKLDELCLELSKASCDI